MQSRAIQRVIAGIPVAIDATMTSAQQTLVRWTFQRRRAAITCQVDARGRSAFDVALVPHADVSGTIVETVGSPARALQLHAEIAKHLVENGWSLVQRTA